MGLSATSPAHKLTFLLSISADGGEPHFRFGVPIIWLLSPSPSGVRRPEVTKYQHLLISPLWPTFFLNGHFLTGFHCSFQREDSINLTSIVSVGYHVTLRSVNLYLITIDCKSWSCEHWRIGQTLLTFEWNQSSL